MRDFFKSIWFKILLVICAALVGLILFGAATGGLTGPDGLFGMITQPLSRAATAVSTTVGGWFGETFNTDSIRAENEELKKQLEELQKKVVDYDNLKTQNEQLKQVAGIKETHTDFELEPASVVARDPDNLYGFTINKGSLQGVEAGDPVMTSAGLVGLVHTVAPTYCQVTTILSPDLQVSGVDTQTGSAGVVCGRADLAESGQCQMLHLDKSTNVSNGSLITTTGSSGIYPPNIVIGSVTEINISDNGMSSYLVLQPSVDVKTVTDVTIVKSFTGQGSQMPTQE